MRAADFTTLFNIWFVFVALRGGKSFGKCSFYFWWSFIGACEVYRLLLLLRVKLLLFLTFITCFLLSLFALLRLFFSTFLITRSAFYFYILSSLLYLIFYFGIIRVLSAAAPLTFQLISGSTLTPYCSFCVVSSVSY